MSADRRLLRAGADCAHLHHEQLVRAGEPDRALAARAASRVLGDLADGTTPEDSAEQLARAMIRLHDRRVP